MKSLVRASLGGSTYKVYLGKWNKWLDFIKKKGRGPWLNCLTSLRCLRSCSSSWPADCFYLITSSPLSEGTSRELTTSHCMIAAAGKGINMFWGMSGKNAQVRLPLTWSILAHGYLTVTSSQEGEDVMWLGLALSYFLLCQASELFAYANGLVHPDFCLTRDCLTFFRGDIQVNIEDRARADSVRVLFVASKTDQNREGCTTTCVRMAEGAGVGKTPVGAFEALVELLDAHPQLPGGAPLMTRRTASGWKVTTRTEAVVALRMMAASADKNPAQFALHSGRIGGATKLPAQGMSELQIQRTGRWKSRVFMVYVRDAGEGAQKVSAALTREG